MKRINALFLIAFVAATAWAGTYTTNLSLYKPVRGETGYVTPFATSMDTLDAAIPDKRDTKTASISAVWTFLATPIFTYGIDSSTAAIDELSVTASASLTCPTTVSTLTVTNATTLNTANISTATITGYAAGRWGGYKTIAAGDTTPSVAGTHFLVYSTAADLTITNFDDGVDGQVVTILCAAPNTLTITREHAYLPGAANATLGGSDTITLVKYGASWYAVAGPNSNS